MSMVVAIEEVWCHTQSTRGGCQ
uniref:Uncharacterized protein n=1 Tax=Arundo donax TaxID=35708 RepID=A0A0A9BHS4_ARUDO